MLPDATVTHVSNGFEHCTILASLQESLSEYLSRSKWLSGVQDFKNHSTLVQFHQEHVVFCDDGLDLSTTSVLLTNSLMVIFLMEGIETQTFCITNKKKESNYKPTYASIFPQINDILPSWQLTKWLCKKRENINFRKKGKVNVLGRLNVKG